MITIGYTSNIYNKSNYTHQNFELKNAKSGILGTARKVKARIFGTSQTNYPDQGYTLFVSLTKGVVTDLNSLNPLSFGSAPGKTQLNIVNNASYSTTSYVWGTWFYN